MWIKSWIYIYERTGKGMAKVEWKRKKWERAYVRLRHLRSQKAAPVLLVAIATCTPVLPEMQCELWELRDGKRRVCKEVLRCAGPLLVKSANCLPFIGSPVPVDSSYTLTKLHLLVHFHLTIPLTQLSGHRNI